MRHLEQECPQNAFNRAHSLTFIVSECAFAIKINKKRLSNTKAKGCSPSPSLEETEIAALGAFAVENRLFVYIVRRKWQFVKRYYIVENH